MKNPHQACPAWQQQSDRQLNLNFYMLHTQVNGNASPAIYLHKTVFSALFMVFSSFYHPGGLCVCQCDLRFVNY